jgi:hypothetical protein
MIGQKQEPGGTQPQATGSDQRSVAAPSDAHAHQQRLTTKKMDKVPKSDKASVDRWFDRQLNLLYSEVIAEPLPKEFLELIDKLREKTPEK